MTSFFGILAGFGIFAVAIVTSTDGWGAFLSASSLMMVAGGTLAAAFMSYPAPMVGKGLRAIAMMLVDTHKRADADLNRETKRLIRWAYVAQKKGTQGIEEEVGRLKMADDPVLHYGALLVSTGYPSQELRPMLETVVDSHYERNIQPAQVLKQMSAAAPAFGMIGTLVGLVIMLQGLDGDMSQLGKGLSLALLTTLYGVILARMVFTPAALKLIQQQDEERFRNELIIEGLVMVAEKKGPRMLQDRLNSFLHHSAHFDLDKQLETRRELMKEVV